MCTLAMRSAEAVKKTSERIESSMKAVKSGNELTSSAQEAFKDNIDGLVVAAGQGRVIQRV